MLNGLTQQGLEGIINSYSGEENKIKTCRAFFDYDHDKSQFGVQTNTYQCDQSHFTCKNNLKNALKKHYIQFN